MGSEEKNRSLIFTYGTLKRGFPNHRLIEGLMPTGDAIFLGIYRTVERYPLVCGPFRVPFLINLSGHGDRVWGELYAMTGKGLERMDELEGTTRGHYERLPMVVVPADEAAHGNETRIAPVVRAEAYYAHRSYGEELWRSNGERGFCKYSEDETSGYVRRTERPQNVSFLEHIQLFCSSSSSSSSSYPRVTVID
ncbi:putative gamma-glutamylcyclotransferase At3g02910 [Telopea speciosissima]|uniref:putative gamma-glutamylcyclotransferase At3g02910 n=1 Tax=Telopea speciosissima TaxID=54955 RepID=UPI001CC689E8|nr:putative gamma-glutamylcyclotransferase At3g02910 [Telopea speciosissima]